MLRDRRKIASEKLGDWLQGNYRWKKVHWKSRVGEVFEDMAWATKEVVGYMRCVEEIKCIVDTRQENQWEKCMTCKTMVREMCQKR